VSRIFEDYNIRNPNQNRAAFWRISHQLNVRQPIGRKDSLQAVCRKIRRLEAFLYFAAQNFELFTKIQDKKIKKI
jgi:hypothetical protein